MTQRNTLDGYIAELDSLVQGLLRDYYRKFPTPQAPPLPAGDSAGFYFDLALSRGQEIDRLSEDLAYGKEYNRSLVEALENRNAEVEALKKERDELARQVLEAAGILRPQEEPEVRYFKTTNALHPIYYRVEDGALWVRCDNGCWIGSGYADLADLSAQRKLISVTRDEAEA